MRSCILKAIDKRYLHAPCSRSNVPLSRYGGNRPMVVD